MEPERVDAVVAEARELADRSDDLRAQVMLKMMESVRPGVEQHADEWTANSREAVAIADRTGDDHLRVAVRAAGSYSLLASGDWEEAERLWDEVEEIAGDDHGMGAGIVLGCPVAWTTMARGIVLRERNQLEEARELTEKSLRIAAEHGDVETEGWARGNKVILLEYLGDSDEALALAQRNFELIERLGDVFSRTWAAYNLGVARVARGDFDEGLQALDSAERIYRDAMGRGGEAQGFRASHRADALLGLERYPEALAAAEEAVEATRERGYRWGATLALRRLALARAASGDDAGAEEAFDEAVELARELGCTRQVEEIEASRAELAAGAR